MDYIPRRVNKLVSNILKKYETKKNQLGSRYYKNVISTFYATIVLSNMVWKLHSTIQ